MNLLVPFVDLHPDVCDALLEFEADYVDTSAPGAYWQILADYWARKETFVVVEQDKLPEDGLVQELWDCDRAWCAVRTPMRDTDESAPYPSLSCTKFGGSVMAKLPDLMLWVGDIDFGLGKKEWSRLDLGIAALLQTHWGKPHWHDGVVEHLHEHEEARWVS